MPRKARELSALEVRRLTAPGRHAVGGVDGLFLRVTKAGSRSWVLRYPTGEKRESANGKPFSVYRDIGLGSFPNTSLANARKKAEAIREKLAEGIDPLTEKKAAKQARRAAELRRLSFAQAAEAVVKLKQAEASSAKHARQWETSLATYAVPELGSMAVSDIELVHVKQALEPIWQSKPVTAARVRQRIETVLAWATAHGHRAGPNPAAWKGNLDAVLPAPGKIKKKVHHRAMPIDAMPEFWARLRERDDTPALALAFTILTGCRSGEVLGARWEEIDLANATWIIPPERMKGRREHRVPLAPAAVELLQALPQAEEGLVFTRNHGRKLSDRAMTDLLATMGEKERATVHGFRSTLRDWLSERTATPHDVAEMVLAHAIGNQAEAAYRRGDLMAKRARVMKQWATFLATPASASGKVATIRQNKVAAE
ncbi:tyrosine-type recombinase/integrase [Halomonas sp. PBN3]|uniref:tyrosine-type recombinase/integrase n=1 Tax=Halomonas sp. PBN3 TaxID=1397528 RepID=UPI0004CEC706|nr:site-specific integrase [Halomonas sp. PBN3]